MSDETELRQFEDHLGARRKKLAIFGLLVVGALLIWRFATMASQSTVATAPAERPAIELDVSATGKVTARGCTDTVESCVQRAYSARFTRADGEFSRRAFVHIAPGAPDVAITFSRDVLLLNELIPVNVP
ncbi:MAG: hypothetical protein H0V17_21830 [Deltaproteobacteria bacterium]|nr:hypothetical protein [Deltaproteobacteria bacterium]